MKIITIDGRVGANGTEVKSTTTGKTYARFSLANNTFANGEEKTEWFDIISYDQTFIEKRAQYLGKGSYVIVTGNFRTETRVDKTGKMWVNHYVTATNIDTPRLGSKNSDNQSTETIAVTSPMVSTITGGTKSETVVTGLAQPKPSVASVASSSTNTVYDDDLPF
jgi:single stranded DNA-binding protein